MRRWRRASGRWSRLPWSRYRAPARTASGRPHRARARVNGRRRTDDGGTQHRAAPIDEGFNQHFPAAGRRSLAGKGGNSAVLRRGGTNRGLWSACADTTTAIASDATATAASRAHRTSLPCSGGSPYGLRGLADRGRPCRRIARRERLDGRLIDLIQLRRSLRQDCPGSTSQDARAASCMRCRQAQCPPRSGRTRACLSHVHASVRNPDDPRHFRALDA